MYTKKFCTENCPIGGSDYLKYFDRNFKYMKHSQLLDVVIHTCYSIYLCSKRQ